MQLPKHITRAVIERCKIVNQHGQQFTCEGAVRGPVDPNSPHCHGFAVGLDNNKVLKFPNDLRKKASARVPTGGRSSFVLHL